MTAVVVVIMVMVDEGGFRKIRLRGEDMTWMGSRIYLDRMAFVCWFWGKGWRWK